MDTEDISRHDRIWGLAAYLITAHMSSDEVLG